ncbi:hypothetical protein PIB30_053813 [Stylosanthes scabra]|uniref:Uncharacterized protein n=1 Tax=Stylosanthes scabra TaxID=79078 RepID=A0ABU6QI86_9FABA|nr:hypothetical protein [Stylosanthes scabra]
MVEDLSRMYRLYQKIPKGLDLSRMYSSSTLWLRVQHWSSRLKKLLSVRKSSDDVGTSIGEYGPIHIKGRDRNSG